jgi:hypothetical protein
MEALLSCKADTEMKKLANAHRAGAVVLISIGLLSFFEPLITTKPPVMGRTQWSLLDLVRQLHHGGFHGNLLGDVVVPSLSFGLPYLLMLLALASLCFFPSPKLLAWSGVIGAIASALAFRFGDMDLERLFYGKCCSMPGPVKHVKLASVLLIVMVMLTLLSLRGTSESGQQRIRWRLKPERPPEHRDV